MSASLSVSRTVAFFDDNFGGDDLEWNPPKPEGDGYVAVVVTNGKEIRLGRYDTPLEAYEAYLEAKV